MGWTMTARKSTSTPQRGPKAKAKPSSDSSDTSSPYDKPEEKARASKSKQTKKKVKFQKKGIRYDRAKVHDRNILKTSRRSQASKPAKASS